MPAYSRRLLACVFSRFSTNDKPAPAAHNTAGVPCARMRQERSTSSQYIKICSSKPPHSCERSAPHAKAAPLAHGVSSVTGSWWPISRGSCCIRTLLPAAGRLPPRPRQRTPPGLQPYLRSGTTTCQPGPPCAPALHAAPKPTFLPRAQW